MTKSISIFRAACALALLLVLAAFGEPPTVTTFTDTRDGKTYKKVTIGKQVWMAENLNYDVPKVDTDVCYENNAENCVKYGRLYNWETALKACPAGWHLPTDKEWTVLESTDGNTKTAGIKLKSASGWNDYKGKSGNGTDNYGFSALPGGDGTSNGYFNAASYYGAWWNATEYDAFCAWHWYMYNGSEDVGKSISNGKMSLKSVRCVQD